MGNTVMVYGIGVVGGEALEMLGRTEGIDRIVACDINEEWGEFRTNIAATGCIFQGFLKKWQFRQSDVTDIDATARLLEEVKPDAILTGLSTRGPRVLKAAPITQDIRDKLWTVGFGWELPWQLILTAKFTQAVRKSGIQTHVMNSSFPEAVGAILWRHLGYGPTVGLGNVDRIAAAIARHVCNIEKVPLEDVTVYFVSSHALGIKGAKAGVPFFMKIQLGDQDITSKYDTVWLADWQGGCRPHIARRSVVYSITAASGIKNIMHMLRDTNKLTFAPAPNGLFGGYPVRLSAKGVEVCLPKELTLDQALKINVDAEKFDGIEMIKDDGTVVYTDESYGIMKGLGYDCKELTPDEWERRAEEITQVYQKIMALA